MKGWVLQEGVDFVCALQRAIEPSGFHAGLLGSVLHKGGSEKDLDIVIFPIRTGEEDQARLRELLVEFGMVLRHDHESVIAAWRKAGSQDEKHVEVWRWTSTGGVTKRIDLFFMR